MMVQTMYKKALVTGATSGIGRATVTALSANGMEVLAIGRRQTPLKMLSEETGCRWLALDVRENEEVSTQLQAFSPDVLVNNAGVGHGMTGMEDLAPAMIQEAFDINVVAPIQIILSALPEMRKRGGGHIVNIGSISGLHTLLSAVYGGTKSAVHRFSQNLRYELRGSGIRVTEICPGRVSSGFYDAAQGDRKKLDSMGQSSMLELQPEDIVNAIQFALNAPAHVNISTIELLPTEQAVGGIDITQSTRLRGGSV